MIYYIRNEVDNNMHMVNGEIMISDFRCIIIWT